MKTSQSKFYKCGCSAHALEVDSSFVNEDEIYLSIWQYGRVNPSLNWRERIRWCWNIILTGNPWGDSVILNKNQCSELVEQLNSAIQTSGKE
jgi:hypothetical protein